MPELLKYRVLYLYTKQRSLEYIYNTFNRTEIQKLIKSIYINLIFIIIKPRKSNNNGLNAQLGNKYKDFSKDILP